MLISNNLIFKVKIQNLKKGRGEEFSVFVKTLFTILFLLLFSNLTFAQENNKSPKRVNQGSAKKLDGKIWLLPVYIYTEEKWSNEDKSLFMNILDTAQSWLNTQADSNKKSISFDNQPYKLKNEIKVDEINVGIGSGAEKNSWAIEIIEKLGFKDAIDFDNWVKKNVDCDNYAFLIVSNLDGRCYSLSFEPQFTKSLYYVECTKIYLNNIWPSTVAHEILHLFGAWDLYNSFEQSKEIEKRAKHLWPDEIMLRIDQDINNLKISSLTQWLIGWKKQEEAFFYIFEPGK